MAASFLIVSMSVSKNAGPPWAECVRRGDCDALFARQVLPRGHQALAIAAITMKKNDQRYRRRGRLRGNQKLIRALVAVELERA